MNESQNSLNSQNLCFIPIARKSTFSPIGEKPCSDCTSCSQALYPSNLKGSFSYLTEKYIKGVFLG